MSGIKKEEAGGGWNASSGSGLKKEGAGAGGGSNAKSGGRQVM